jgi:hypothetical protein
MVTGCVGQRDSKTTLDAASASRTILTRGRLMRGQRRLGGALGVVLLFGGCGSPEVPPPQPSAKAVLTAWPSRPVAAFRVTDRGAYTSDYELVSGTCVHGALLARATKKKLDTQLAAYCVGAVSSRVGGAPATTGWPKAGTNPARLDVSRLPPNALTTQRLDAQGTKAKRIADLEIMI